MGSVVDSRPPEKRCWYSPLLFCSERTDELAPQSLSGMIQSEQSVTVTHNRSCGPLQISPRATFCPSPLKRSTPRWAPSPAEAGRGRYSGESRKQVFAREWLALSPFSPSTPLPQRVRAAFTRPLKKRAHDRVFPLLAHEEKTPFIKISRTAGTVSAR
ncbi:hypothetical protein GJAV_G00227400 [Gymnothorax javanicus]|nr:hypothetical protein GJAV_G00227400 [Gymnothorax javanicus]